MSRFVPGHHTYGKIGKNIDALGKCKNTPKYIWYFRLTICVFTPQLLLINLKLVRVFNGFRYFVNKQLRIGKLTIMPMSWGLTYFDQYTILLGVALFIKIVPDVSFLFKLKKNILNYPL